VLRFWTIPPPPTPPLSSLLPWLYAQRNSAFQDNNGNKCILEETKGQNFFNWCIIIMHIYGIQCGNSTYIQCIMISSV
jgi:hypothetical protein